MKLTVQKEDILYAVNAVGRAISTKNTLPILSGILLEAPADLPGKLILRSTDLDLAMECFIDAEVEEFGKVVAPGRYLQEMVRHLPEGAVSFNAKNAEELILSYEQSEIAVRCLDPEEFPVLPTAEGNIKGQIAVAVFRRMVKQVSIAAATDDVRPLFTGILIELAGSKLIMVASDTHRLAIAVDNWQGEGDMEAKLILPCRTMQEIGRLAQGDEGLVEIVASRNQAFFRLGNITFVSRVISGQYPDYHQVLPSPTLYNCHTFIQREKLMESLERAALLSRETARGKANIVSLNWCEENLILSAESPEVGHIHEELPATLTGESTEASYNARYLLDALKVIDEENVSFHLTGSTTPGIILPNDAEIEESAYTYLVLPVRVSR
ncbi:MAG: DNA polymerase III subunit beta [Clostridiales bacterium]|nr:DNA polymerase III subunit beta [Clostridiales bacterium]